MNIHVFHYRNTNVFNLEVLEKLCKILYISLISILNIFKKLNSKIHLIPSISEKELLAYNITGIY